MKYEMFQLFKNNFFVSTLQLECKPQAIAKMVKICVMTTYMYMCKK